MGEARLAVRSALRRSLSDLAPDAVVLVACSGGPDSLALALACADEARSSERRFAAAVIDHGLQPGSRDVAEEAARACRAAGLAPVEVIGVSVDGPGGIENAARDARRAALLQAAEGLGATAILLAHTRDDQAETVLIRLGRGSGARSLAGMAPVDGPWRRPLLELPRAIVHASLEGSPAWTDPHNANRDFARVRVRLDALPALVEALGPDVVDGLARSAVLLRDDADALDALADEAWRHARVDGAAEIELDVFSLESLPRAVRTRVLRRAAIEAGCPPAALTRDHVLAVEALVTDWRGQGQLALPGQIRAGRERSESGYARLTLRRVAGHPQGE